MALLGKCSLGLMFHFPGFHLEKLFFVCSGFLPFFHFFFSLMKRKSSQKEKSRRAPAQAKTPSQRLNGNELAALKQISVLTAFALVFLYACSAEANLTFSGSLAASPSVRAVCFASLAKAPFFLARLRHRLLFQINFYKFINKV